MCQVGEGLHQGTLGFVDFIEHDELTFGNVAVQYNSFWGIPGRATSSLWTRVGLLGVFLDAGN
jgi:hypothetical protein